MKQVVSTITKSAYGLFLACCALLLSVSAMAQNPCNAHFTFRNDTINLNTVYLSSSANPTGTKFSWSFGDGSYSTSVNPVHQYSHGGKYLVCLKVENTAVPCQDLICDSITVGTGGFFPVCDAHFFHYALQTNPDSVHFYTSTNNNTTKKYSWSFGDGTGSDNSMPWHNYANPGTYYVCLTVTDSTASGKCTDTKCDSVKVNALPKPICDAHFQHTSYSNTDTVYFYSGQHTASTKYSWSFGDGGTSDAANPKHKYAPGKYLACLIITDSTAGGKCTADFCDSIIVGNNTGGTCNAHYTFKQDTINSSLYTIKFTSSANPGGTKYTWSFGDGTSSTTASPIHSYAHAGTYWVCLKVENPYVPCSETICDSVHVNSYNKPICDAHFQHYALPQNPDSVHFYSATGSSSAKHYWYFGDGTYSDNSNPWHYYANPGTYYVCHMVKDSTAAGTCSETWCDSVKVGNNTTLTCNAHFKKFFASNTGNNVHFESSPNPAGTSYSWNFGDGGTSTDPNPYHTYAAAGKYIACLTVINTSIPCYSTWCDTVEIKGAPKPNCNAHFVHYSSYTNRDSVKFYVTPPNASTAKYSWTFGDGGTSDAAAPWHLYPGPGKYYACLTVTDSTAGGTCTSSWCDTIRIEKPLPPVCDAHFKWYKKPTNADSLHFYPAATNNNSTTKKYTWDFGDGSTSHDIYPWHYYPNPGIYYVCLTVTDTTAGGSCIATWCDSVHTGIIHIPCNAHFTKFSTNSTNTSIHFVPAPNSLGTKYTWNFGDGTSSHNVDPTHLYANYGTYYVCLTVRDSSASGICEDTWCDSVKVGVPPIPCNAKFKYQNAYYMNAVYFTHAPNPPGTKYSWDFGDGHSSDNPNPYHQYANDGTYYVCLTVNDSIGNCHDTWCDSIKVGGINANVCNSNFYFKPGNTLHSLYFFSSVNSPATKYHWDFGDGTTSNDKNPFHQYAVAGTYKVCLTTTDTVAGCSDTRCLTIGPLRMAQGGSTLEEMKGDVAANVYPNPMNERGMLHIENTNGAVTFKMFDNTGRLVNTMTNLSNGEFELSKQGLRPGLYLYEVIDADNNSTRGRIVIQ